MTVGGLLGALAFVVPLSSESARGKVMAVLGERLDADVELTDLTFRLFPRFRAEGQGLAVRHKGRCDVPPMIAVKPFTADASIVGLLRKHIASVVVDELDIEIPPGHRESGRPHESGQPTAHGAARDDVGQTIVIDELVPTDGRLSIIPREPNKRPKVWGIHHLRMGSVSLNRAMAFTATLTNAVPPGEIETSGSFGPWHLRRREQQAVDSRPRLRRAGLRDSSERKLRSRL